MRKNTLPMATGLVALLALTACGTDRTGTTGSSGSAGSSSTAPVVGGNEQAARSVAPRVLIAHDGNGLTLLDGATGEVVTETSRPGFLRLSNAGDGRHVLVTDTDVFRVYDAGIWVQQHGDHTHSYTFTPGLTDVSYPAKHAGHVVLHDGKTTLFADGSGEIQTIASDKIADKGAPVEKHTAPSPHHGVAFELADGSLIRTEGTTEGRKTVLVEKGGATVTKTDDCPGVHGEAAAEPTAKGDVAVFGCENGPVVYRDGAFHKVEVADAYARSGNLVGSDASPVVLADYKIVKPPKGSEGVVERPTRVALIDSRTASLRLVDLGSPYWFRSLARGPKGEGVVLTYDGALKVVDAASGKVTASVPVISPWTEKDDWEQPGPAVKVAGYRAYVTDAAKKELVVVDLRTNAVEKRIALKNTPVEMAVVTGRAEAPAVEGRAAH